MSFTGEQQDLFGANRHSATTDAFGRGEEFHWGQFGIVPLQVHLVAPPLVAWGLTRLVQAAGGRFSLGGSWASLQEASGVLQRCPPDAVIVDLDDGYTLEDLRSFYDATRVKILALTSTSAAEFLTSVLTAGARGVLHKREAPSAMLRALESIGRGGMFATPAATERLFVTAARSVSHTSVSVSENAKGQDADAGRIASLTLRERQTVAALVADASAPVKVIAGRLFISEHTLRNHLTSIYSKLGVTGRLDLHAFASRHDLAANTTVPARYR